MIHRIRERLSFANVMSMLALMIALGGTSYAAVTLPRNSVGSAQIRRGAVHTTDLANNAVTSVKVKNRSLRAIDFARGQLPAGPKGADGARGATGPQGPVGSFGAITVVRTDVPLPDNSGAVASLATCPAGTKIIGGGASLEASDSADINLTVSRPYLTGGANNGLPDTGQGFDSWRSVYVNPTGGTGATTARTFAICAQT